MPLKSASSDANVEKFDRSLRHHYHVPARLGRMLISALQGEHRAAILHAVDNLLTQPAEASHSPNAITQEVAAKHTRCLAQLGNVSPEQAGQLISALQSRPEGVIKSVLDLFLKLSDWEGELSGSYIANLQQFGVSNDDNSLAQKPRRPLPSLPKGLTWPEEDFDKAPEFNKRSGAAHYIERVWKPLIPYIDMPSLREHYPKAAKAIDNHREKLPADLAVRTIKQVNDQALASGWVRVEDAERLSRARRRRMANPKP